jgi:hypothetical protein
MHSYGASCTSDNTCIGITLCCELIINHSSGWQLCQTRMVGEVDGSTCCRTLALRLCTDQASDTLMLMP